MTSIQTLLRILYLEDSPYDAELTRHALLRDGSPIELEVAPTVAQALARLAISPASFDLVLCDLSLPDGSGLDLLEHVRTRRLPLAVVILTSSDDEASAISALQAGADDYLLKSGDYLKHLPQILRAALGRFRSSLMHRGRALRVLYAEHDPVDVDLTRRHLARHAPHIRLEVANSGEALLARLPPDSRDPAPCDVVLLDYQLPGANGLAVAKTLRDERGFDLPIVLVTSQGDEESVAAALRIGVADYLVKRSRYLAELPGTLERVFQQAELSRSQARLQTTTEHLHWLLEASPIVLYALEEVTVGDQVRFVPEWVSENIARLFGHDVAAAMQRDWWLSTVHPDDRERAAARMNTLLEDGSLTHEYRILDGAGKVRWVRDQMRLVRGRDGAPAQVVGSWSDITEVRRTEERLRMDAAALESTRDAIIITDLEGGILAVNATFTEITGYTEAEVRGKNTRLLSSGRHEPAFYEAMWSAIRNVGHWRGEIWNRRKNGEVCPELLSISTVRDEHGEPEHYVAVITDLTDVKKSAEQLDRLAHYDPLTELPNRLLFQSSLHRTIERARRNGRCIGLLVINLDQFKTVNESLGHILGDELLVAVARRLRARLRASDTLARPGGDEFAVVLESLADPESAETVAKDILAALELPFDLSDGHEAYVRASIGISIFPNDGTSGMDLLRQADTAMHRAKDQGGDQIAFYTSELNSRALARLELEAALSRALERAEFVLHYQPKVDLRSGRVIGAEALLRWNHPTRGLLSPFAFIPAAERSGMIVAIGAWVIDEACRQMRAWHEAGLDAVKVAVNVSARQFRSGDLESVVRASLGRHRIDSAQLELELTESMLMEAPDAAIARMDILKHVGVRLSLDDFGTGYSSLAYLSRFPVDHLKIDRSFVDGIATDPNAASIATSVIALAHRMGLKVIAEGVETEAQLAYLIRHGCDEMQGYLFSRPIAADTFADLIREGRTLPAAVEPAQSRTLLLVDDEPNILSAIRRTLRGENYRVLTASSAHDGLDLLARNDVQVILSDQRMPKMSGTEFLGRVKALHPDTVRIVLSGYNELESVIQAVNTGSIYRFLTKPWDDEQLRGHLRDAFRYHEAIVKPRAAG